MKIILCPTFPVTFQLLPFFSPFFSPHIFLFFFFFLFEIDLESFKIEQVEFHYLAITPPKG